MYPVPGHIAMSIGGTHLSKSPYLPAIIATLFIDIIDKVFADVLPIAPYGRCWFHTLLSVALCSYLVGKWKGKEWGLSWMIGHLLHLVGDMGFVPWFYPFVSYDWPTSENMVLASMKGLQESIHGFYLLQDASGNWTLAGWEFSDLVRQVFQGKLLLIELGILIAACGMILCQTYKWIKLKKACLWVFFLSIGLRLVYVFPPVLNWFSYVLE